MKRLRDWWGDGGAGTSGENSRSSERIHKDQASSNETAKSMKVGSDGNDGSIYLHSNVKGESETIEAGKVLQVTSNPQPSQSHEQKVEKMLKTINEQMWNKVNKVFQIKKLNKPNYEVYPQIVESPNFYEGEHKVDNRQSSGSRRSEYVKEKMFQFKRSSVNQCLSFKSVLQEFCEGYQSECNNQLAVYGLFAQAGAGKTTYMRNWAKQIMLENGMSPENDYSQSADSRFQLLLYYDLNSPRFRDASKITTLQDLLLKGLELGSEVKDPEFAFEWLNKNQHKVSLFLDGLDQTPWKITEEDAQEIAPAEEATIPTILGNLLTRNLLPKCRVIISSREFKASALPEEARPQKVYTLTGFKLEDAELLFNELVSQEYHENPFKEISKTSSFQHFLTIPMFLTFAALVYSEFHDHLPNSVTELLAKVLELLQNSRNVREKARIWQIISKLKRLAQKGMEKGVVVFTEKDLKAEHLEMEDARDLLLKVPQSKILNQCLLEGDFTLFFCHQIIQEFLSACSVAERSLESFIQFVEVELHDERWTVVRQFVCGLLFHDSIDENMIQITDKEDKKKIIRKSLIHRIPETSQDPELFASIYESDDDQLIQSITEINVPMQRHTCYTAHMISSLMARTKYLEDVSIWFVDDELLNVMAANLKNVRVRAERINLWSSWFSATGFNNFLQNIDSDQIYVRHSDSLYFNQQEIINWENIRWLLLDRYCPIFFSNRQNSVEVCVKEDNDTKVCSGIFDKKNKTLVFDREVSDHCCIIQSQLEASAWLSPKSISINIKGLCAQYLDYADLHDMEKWQSHVKVDEIVLNAKDMNDEDDGSTVSDKIMSLVRLFQVQILNIVIHLESVHRFPLQLEHDLSEIGCELKIQTFERVRDGADLQKLTSTLRESQILYFRLELSKKIEVEDLLSFLKSCNVTKQLVINGHLVFNFTHSDIEELKDAAESSRFNLTFKVWNGFDSKDAWSCVY